MQAIALSTKSIYRSNQPLADQWLTNQRHMQPQQKTWPQLVRWLNLFWRKWRLLLIGSLLLNSCAARPAPDVRTITLQQQWTFNPGDEIAGNLVTGSLGDISLYLEDGHVKAPFDGKLEPSELEKCALYSTPEIPAYLFRLCGLKKFVYGEVRAGKHLGKGEILSFATLRRQPNGMWIIVEPARGVLEKALMTK